MAPSSALYRVRQPKLLETWATEALASWIASQPQRLLSPTFELYWRAPTRAEELISRQIKMSRNYLEINLSWKFHDTLAIEVIEQLLLKRTLNYSLSSNLTRAVREQTIIGRMIEILFTRNLTSLSFDTHDVNSYHMRAVQDTLFSQSYLLTGLSHLNLCVNLFKEENLIRCLKELHNLKHLSIDHCSHNIIRCLAENCKLLEVLESRNDNNINEESVDILKGLSNLRSIYLMHSKISQKGIEALLLSDKNIEIRITMIYYSQQQFDLERCLECFESSDEHAEKQFNLKYYVCRPEITLPRLHLVFKMCPFIQELELYNADPNQFHISPLLQLQHLRKLVLHRFHFYTNRLIDVLQVRGSNLIHLRFEDDIELDLNALICVSQTCPNLESLYIEYCDFQKQSSAYDLVNSKKLALKSTFRKLTSLTVDWVSGSTEPNEELFFLLSSCPNVKFINIDNYNHPITDNFMLRVLDKNPLIYLQELKLRYKLFRLGRTNNGQSSHGETHPESTMLFIDRITQNCLSPPEITISSGIYE